MAFLSGIAQFAEANPALLASGLQLLTGSLGNGAGNAGNAAMNALAGQSEIFQTSMYAEQLAHQERMQMISQSFDEMMDQKSESMREQNTLRDVNMAQRKADNAITKKFIESITE
ncbi:MAG TPA: hypothetical protein VFL13_15160 [Candidatus Baltobacteraceae bacterium]|nr:hypothetical protein [Candidatus Baltobacteraceae bacterium]